MKAIYIYVLSIGSALFLSLAWVDGGEDMVLPTEDTDLSTYTPENLAMSIDSSGVLSVNSLRAVDAALIEFEDAIDEEERHNYVIYVEKKEDQYMVVFARPKTRALSSDKIYFVDDSTYDLVDEIIVE